MFDPPAIDRIFGSAAFVSHLEVNKIVLQQGKCAMFNNSEGLRFARIGLTAVMIAAIGLVGRAWAIVKLEAKVTDTEAGATFSTTPLISGTITQTATSLDHTLPGNPPLSVTATASGTASGATSYAYAGVSDSISGGLAKKTVSSIVLVPPGSSGITTAYADPTGPVTMQVIPTSGNPTQNVIMQFAFPAVGSSDVDQITPSSTELSGFLNGAALPSQEVVRSNGGLTTTQVGSFFDVTFTVLASVDQAATGLNETLFNGQAVFHADGSVSFTGDFINYMVGSQTTPDPKNSLLQRTSLTGLPTIPFTVEGSTDFDLTVDLTMSIGDPNGPDFTLGTALSSTAGAAAVFTAGAEPADRSDYQLVATPEPGSLTLAALGTLALAGYGWRKRRLSSKVA